MLLLWKSQNVTNLVKEFQIELRVFRKFPKFVLALSMQIYLYFLLIYLSIYFYLFIYLLICLFVSLFIYLFYIIGYYILVTRKLSAHLVRSFLFDCSETILATSSKSQKNHQKWPFLAWPNFWGSHLSLKHLPWLENKYIRECTLDSIKEIRSSVLPWHLLKVRRRARILRFDCFSKRVLF